MPSKSKYRVFIADDQPILRTTLRRCLGDREDVEIVGEAGNGAELLDFAAAQLPDLVVMEMSMPDIQGDQVISALRAKLPASRLLVLSKHAETGLANKAIKAGANGFFFKSGPIAELIRAFQCVLDGEYYLPPGILETLQKSVPTPVAAGTDNFAAVLS